MCATVSAHMMKSLLSNQIIKYEKTHFLKISLRINHFKLHLGYVCVVFRVCYIGLLSQAFAVSVFALFSNLSEPLGLVHGLLCLEGTFARNLCLEPTAQEGKAHGLVFYGPHTKNGFYVFKGLFKKKIESVTETICKLKYLLSGLYRVCQTLLCEVMCFNFKNSRKSCVLHIIYVLVLMDKDVLPNHVPL